MARIETPWGVWDAAPVAEVVKLFSDLAAPWWLSGGYAIELAVGHAYREHGDVDISVLRRDQLAVRRHLADWDPHVADPAGTLRPWAMDEVLPDRAHDIWVREHADGPWRFQLMLEETDGDEWIYRRDPRIHRPLGSVSQDHRIALEVQLLYKAKGLRHKDQLDFTRVLPLLTRSQRAWLEEALGVEHGTHPWLDRLRGWKDPASFLDEANWAGGFFELILEYGEADEATLTTAMQAVQTAAEISHFFPRRDAEPEDQQPVPVSAAAPMLQGVVRLPNGVACVCGIYASQVENEPAKITFCLPTGALNRTERGGQAVWTGPIVSWLAEVGRHVNEVAPSDKVLIGFELDNLS